ncbi:hypothetical protein AAG570_003462 [Ranatra chinensis]|uniref:Kazal-like domain-containing protein n=1 Tax=Ranatra chinensis TaxID=642074 RepID=A0ABD0Y3Q3_9HEMI
MSLCTKMFSTEWAASWKIFDEECLTPIEENLAQCIDEVDEPCELGCEGLSYCTTFNNRPTELFRSCDYESDSAARIDVGMWQQRGYVTLPTIQKLFIRNISNCSPIMWKTIACTLQIKPCHRQSHVNRICWEDCFSVLSACLDWEMMGETTTVAKVCSAISVRETDAPCISLDPYLSPSINPYMDAVTRPCKTYPCGPSQVCHVNRSCDSSNDCKSYFCSPGCKLGEMSLHVVPAWTYVRIPTGSGQKGCYRVCQCTLQGTLSPFKEVTCITPNGCKVGDKEHDHGSVFYNDCNMCTCYAGEITCTKKQCKISSGVANTAFTSLPCNCPQTYVPVCAWNGITYPSSCLAKCSELSAGNFLYETCESKDPCASNPCSQSEICVPKRKVCLSKLYNICTQYVCGKIFKFTVLNPSDSCNHLPDEPVCDTNGEQHSNLCFMLRHKKQLAYHGPCLPGCNNSGEVCGVDGTTYQSECLALSRMISIDYSGPCITVGLINENPQQQCANFVECPPLAEKDCLGYTPPGACCPICAGAVKMLFSQKQIDRALHALNGQPIEAFTVEAIIRGLQRQVGVAECSVRGHLTLEGDILVLVVPTVVGGPSVLRFEACLREAEKLAILVQRESPRIVSELSLSVLTAATIVHQHVPAAALSASMPSLCTLISSSALLLISRLAFNLMLAV